MCFLYDIDVGLAIKRSRVQMRTSCSHTCASVTKQYNLVLANGWSCCLAGKVTTGLAESSGSLMLGLWPVGRLPRDRDQLWTKCRYWVRDYLYVMMISVYVRRPAPAGSNDGCDGFTAQRCNTNGHCLTTGTLGNHAASRHDGTAAAARHCGCHSTAAAWNDGYYST